MADPAPPRLPPPGAEHRRIAAGQFEHANQVLAAHRNYTYGITLLLSCCKLDPGNLLYRQALRRTQKAKYNNNQRGSLLAWLTTWPARARLKAARQAGDHLKVLEHGEQILCRNPWDVGAQMDMAEAAEALGLFDLAVWLLEQARQKQSQDPAVNRALALLYERRGSFTQAAALWELVRRADPADPQAASKLKDLAAAETIAKGQYEAAAALGVRNGAADDVERTPGPVLPAAPRQARSDAEQLRARLAADPTNADLYLRLAALYRKAGDLEQAHAVLGEGLGATGGAFELHCERTDLEIEPFRRNLAVTEQKLRLSPDDPELLRLRVRLRKEINTRELELYRAKADRFPADLAPRLELGIRLLRAGQTEEAIRELQAARGDARLRWQAAYYLGLCFKARNNWPLAQRNFDEALRELPPGEDDARKDLLFQLAHGAAQTGDLTRAVEIGQELAYLDYAYRDIGRMLEEWQARLPQAG